MKVATVPTLPNAKSMHEGISERLRSSGKSTAPIAILTVIGVNLSLAINNNTEQHKVGR